MRFFVLLLAAVSAQAQPPLTEREKMLLERIEKLEQRLAVLEARSGVAAAAPATVAQSPAPAPAPAPAAPSGTTLGVNLDGYYGYNFNQPYNGMNTLRAYDVSSNGFSLNQADLVIEHAPDLAHGQRLGLRLDLMFGQATETLQGSPANEPRPGVFRHVYQAYGTYIAPLGKGLTVDFGKWASSFGLENNYTKDQLNYSRSYWFNFLPYYHMGFRASYPVTSTLTASYWVTNGVNQTEDFNGFKSQAVLLSYTPVRTLSANLNYFNGQEQRTVNGLTPRGRTHFLDSYLTWQPTERWTFAAEGDYAISRVDPASAPQLVTGGAAYARYRFHPRFNLASRFTYLNDSGGWFSGSRQSLKDATLTATFDLATGFQMRCEARRDWSNVAYFAAADPSQQRRQQTTALLGLIWWFGGREGVW